MAEVMNCGQGDIQQEETIDSLAETYEPGSNVGPDIQRLRAAGWKRKPLRELCMSDGVLVANVSSGPRWTRRSSVVAEAS